MRRSVMAFAAALLLSACAGTEPTQYHLLDPGPAEATAAPAGVRPVGLREVRLPLYARRPQIALRGDGNAVTLSDTHYWAEETPQAASRIVARRIEAGLGRPVVVEPWSVAVRPDVRVEVEVDRFIGRLGGAVELSGRYRIEPLGSEGEPVSRSFRVVEAAVDPEVAALVAAHGRALMSLGDGIAAALRPDG